MRDFSECVIVIVNIKLRNAIFYRTGINLIAIANSCFFGINFAIFSARALTLVPFLLLPVCVSWLPGFSWFPGFPSLCCTESEDSRDLNSETSYQQQPVFHFPMCFSKRSDVLHTVTLTVCKYKPCQQSKPHQS